MTSSQVRLNRLLKNKYGDNNCIQITNKQSCVSRLSRSASFSLASLMNDPALVSTKPCCGVLHVTQSGQFVVSYLHNSHPQLMQCRRSSAATWVRSTSAGFGCTAPSCRRRCNVTMWLMSTGPSSGTADSVDHMTEIN